LAALFLFLIGGVAVAALSVERDCGAIFGRSDWSDCVEADPAAPRHLCGQGREEKNLKRENILNSRSVLRTATYWRMRGEEVRSIAEGVKDPTANAIMGRIADDYDRLAAHAEINTALGVEAMLACTRESANLAKTITIQMTAESYQAVTGKSPDSTAVDDVGRYSVKLDQETVDRLTIMELAQSLSDVITAGKQRSN
jgi:hypothetical protein